MNHASLARAEQIRVRLEAAAHEVVRRGAIGVAAKIVLPGVSTVCVAAVVSHHHFATRGRS